MTTIRIAFLDSYQDPQLHERFVKIDSFTDHLTGEDELVNRLEPFQIIVAMRERTPFPKDLLKRLTNLKLLITTGPANAAIDVEACKDLHIKCGGTPFKKNLLISTREISWTLILACSKHMLTETDNFKNGHWQTTVGGDLLSKTLGIYGAGNIGQSMVPIAKAFGMNVVAWSANLTKAKADEAGVQLADSLVDLAKKSDFLSIHYKLSDRSKGTINAEVLKALGSTSYLINTSRGPIVDEKALISALQNKEIAGAGLDVFDIEPLPKDHPLRALDNVVATPHVGYGTAVNYKSFYEGILESLTAYVKDGTVLNQIA